MQRRIRAGGQVKVKATDNSIKHLKFGEPITFNFSWCSREECPEMDFGSSAMSVPTLSFRKIQT